MADVDQEIGIGPQELMPDIAKRLEVLLDDSGHGREEILGVGLSIPGTADTIHGCSLDSPTMSGWDGISLPPYLRELTSAPIRLDNDANVIVLSERRGQRDRFDDMLLIKASTGLGAGIVAGGYCNAAHSAAQANLGTPRYPPRLESCADAATPAALRPSRQGGPWSGRCSSRAVASGTSATSLISRSAVIPVRVDRSGKAAATLARYSPAR